MTNHAFIFGLGYAGTAIAHELLAQGWQVSGTTRDQEKQRALQEMGIDAHIFDGTSRMDNTGTAALEKSTHILSTIDPDYKQTIDPVLTMHATEISDHAKWTGYLSSISVYGSHKGEILSETTQPTPATPRAIKRHNIEQEWQKMPNAHLIRCAGIYGPDRIPFEDFLSPDAHLNPESLVDDWIKGVFKDSPERRVHHIHLEDLARITAGSMQKDAPPIINAIDKTPKTTEEILMHTARIGGVADYFAQNRPEICTAELSSPFIASFFEQYAIFDNSLAERLAGSGLRYPSATEGIDALVAQKTIMNNQYKIKNNPTLTPQSPQARR